MVPDFGTEEKHPLVFTADRTITQFKVDVGQGIWSRPISLSYAQVVMMKRAELERGVCGTVLSTGARPGRPAETGLAPNQRNLFRRKEVEHEKPREVESV